MKAELLICAAAAIVFGASAAHAQSDTARGKREASKGHVAVKPDDMHWGRPPAGVVVAGVERGLERADH